MSKKERLIRAIKHPRYIGSKILCMLAHWIKDDEWYVKMRYRLYVGKSLNLDRPQTYNEKLNWQKLYDHNPLYTTMVDKYAVKDYVAGIIGKQYIIPTIGHWERPEDIDLENLPEQFVLKTTHDSGGVVVVKDKSKLNKGNAIKKLNRCLESDNYAVTREWPYKNVHRRVIAEQYMEDEKTGELRDYKFFCFDGEVKALFISQDRGKVGEEVKFDYYDANFNHLDIHQYHDAGKSTPERPVCFDEMKILASKLSKGLPQVRVDFYEVNGKVYFGELTFFHHGGIVPFTPEKWDYIFGSWIELPKEKRI